MFHPVNVATATTPGVLQLQLRRKGTLPQSFGSLRTFAISCFLSLLFLNITETTMNIVPNQTLKQLKAEEEQKRDQHQASGELEQVQKCNKRIQELDENVEAAHQLRIQRQNIVNQQLRQKVGEEAEIEDLGVVAGED